MCVGARAPNISFASMYYEHTMCGKLCGISFEGSDYYESASAGSVCASNTARETRHIQQLPSCGVWAEKNFTTDGDDPLSG